jgi:hypothetical protein
MSKVKKALEDLKNFAAKELNFNTEEVESLVEDLTPDTNSEEASTEVVEVKLAEAQLEDGTMIQVEPELAVGAVAAIEDPEAGFMPIPAGSYNLADGRVMVVEEGGVIAEVTEVAEEEEAMDTESKEAPEMTGEEIKKIIESVTTVFKSQIEDLKKEMDDLQMAFTANNEKNVELNGKFITAVEALADEPSKEPTQKKKEKSPFLKTSKDQRMKNLEAFAKFNKTNK